MTDYKPNAGAIADAMIEKLGRILSDRAAKVLGDSASENWYYQGHFYIEQAKEIVPALGVAEEIAELEAKLAAAEAGNAAPVGGTLDADAVKRRISDLEDMAGDGTMDANQIFKEMYQLIANPEPAPVGGALDDENDSKE